MDPIKQFLDDIVRSTVQLSAPVQNRLASLTAEALRSGGNINTPINLYGLNLPEQVSTVGDASQLLVRSMYPSLMQLARGHEARGLDFVETFSQGVTGILSKLPEYGQKPGQFWSYASWSAYGANKNLGRSEGSNAMWGSYGLEAERGIGLVGSGNDPGGDWVQKLQQITDQGNYVQTPFFYNKKTGNFNLRSGPNTVPLTLNNEDISRLSPAMYGEMFGTPYSVQGNWFNTSKKGMSHLVNFLEQYSMALPDQYGAVPYTKPGFDWMDNLSRRVSNLPEYTPVPGLFRYGGQFTTTPRYDIQTGTIPFQASLSRNQISDYLDAFRAEKVGDKRPLQFQPGYNEIKAHLKNLSEGLSGKEYIGADPNENWRDVQDIGAYGRLEAEITNKTLKGVGLGGQDVTVGFGGATFADSNRPQLIGRQDILERVQSYIGDDAVQPLINQNAANFNPEEASVYPALVQKYRRKLFQWLDKSEGKSASVPELIYSPGEMVEGKWGPYTSIEAPEGYKIYGSLGSKFPGWGFGVKSTDRVSDIGSSARDVVLSAEANARLSAIDNAIAEVNQLGPEAKFLSDIGSEMARTSNIASDAVGRFSKNNPALAAINAQRFKEGGANVRGSQNKQRYQNIIPKREAASPPNVVSKRVAADPMQPEAPPPTDYWPDEEEMAAYDNEMVSMDYQLVMGEGAGKYVHKDTGETVSGDNPDAVYVSAYRRGDTIYVDDKYLSEHTFQQKSWTQPRIQKDKTYAKALPEDIFKDEKSLVDFAVQHEVEHIRSPRASNETYGDYETRINNAALTNTGLTDTSKPKPVMTDKQRAEARMQLDQDAANARAYIEENHPRFAKEFLGRGKTKMREFGYEGEGAWEDFLGAMDPETRAEFEAAQDIINKQHKSVVRYGQEVGGEYKDSKRRSVWRDWMDSSGGWRGEGTKVKPGEEVPARFKSFSDANTKRYRKERGIDSSEPEAARSSQSGFVPSEDWQEIPDGIAVPPGGEYRLELGGKRYGRWTSSPTPQAAGGGGDAIDPPGGGTPPGSPPDPPDDDDPMWNKGEKPDPFSQRQNYGYARRQTVPVEGGETPARGIPVEPGVGVREKLLKMAANDIKPSVVRGLDNHPVYGRAMKGDNGTWSFQRVGVGGEVVTTLDDADIDRVSNLASGALNYAAAGPLPEGSRSQLATISARVNKFIDDYVNKMFDGAENDPIVRKQATAARAAARAVVGDKVEEITAEMKANAGVGGNTIGQYKDIQYNSTWVKNAEELERVAAKYPRVAAYVDQMGGAQQAIQGPRAIIEADDGGSFSFGYDGGDGGGGNYGTGGYGPRRQRGIFGGPLGQAMYGAYIGRRMWSMTMAPFMRASDEYADYEASIGAMADGRFDPAGPGGMAARRSSFTKWLGQGAYNTYGWAGDAMAGILSGTGQGVSQVASYGMGAGAAAIIGQLVPSMAQLIPGVAQSPAAMQLLGRAAPMAGLAAGGAILGTGIGLGVGNLIGGQMVSSFEQAFGFDAPGYGNDWKPQALADVGRTVGRLWAIKQYNRNPEDLARYLENNRGLQSFLEGPADYRSQSDRDALAAFGYRTGHKSDQFAGFYAASRLAYGGTISEGTDAFEKMLSVYTKSIETGTNAESMMNAGISYAAQMGVMPGTQQSFGMATSYATSSSTQRYLMDVEAGQRASIAGTVQSYLPGGMPQAYGLTQGYQTPAQTQVFQQLLASAVGGGYDLSEIVSYAVDPAGLALKTDARGHIVNPEVNATAVMRPVTLADQLSSMGLDMTQRELNRISPIAERLQRSGYGMVSSITSAAGMTDQDVSSFTTLYDLYSQAGPVSMERSSSLLGMNVSPYQASQIASIGSQYMSAGTFGKFDAAAYANVPATSMPLVSAMASGDLKAWSYASYNGLADQTNRFFNQYGQKIYQTDMGSFFNMIRGQAYEMGNQGAQWAMVPGIGMNYAGTSVLDQTRAFFEGHGALGTGDQQAMQAWADGGMYARTQLHVQRMGQLSMASAGNAMAGIILRENFQWGANQGGTWDSPTADSIWGIQDRLRDLQHKSTLASFGSSLERMDLQAGWARQQDEMTRQSTEVSRGYQDYTRASQREVTMLGRDFSDWNQSFGFQTSLMQRGFARDQWAFQRSMSGMQFGWQMEDLDDAIKRSGGYERKKLLEQKDRAATVYGLETANTSERQSQQEQLWAREDERYNKQIEHTDQLREIEDENFEKQTEYIAKVREMEDEQFEFNIEQREKLYDMDRQELERKLSEYKQQYKLEQELQEKQREFQYEQMQLQKAAVGIQAAMAQEQMEYNSQVEITTQAYERTAGSAELIFRYKPEVFLDKLDAMVKRLGDTSTVNVTGMNAMFREIDQVNYSNVTNLTRLMNTIDGINTSKLSYLISLLESID